MDIFDDRVERRLRRVAESPHHAYLFSGPGGSGKREAAGWFAALLDCEADGKRPCGECRSCLEVARDSHPEVVQIRDDGAAIKIDQIRELIHALGLSRISGPYRIAIIEEARRLTREAEAALLKTLEEPAQGVVIILTDSTGELSDTIVSRCHTLVFSLLSEEGLAGKFTELSAAGLQAAAGRPALAQRFLADPERLDSFREQLGQVERLFEGDLVDRFRAAEELAASEETRRLLADWLITLHRRLQGAREEERIRLAQRIELALAGLNDLERGANARLVLEALVLEGEY